MKFAKKSKMIAVVACLSTPWAWYSHANSDTRVLIEIIKHAEELEESYREKDWQEAEEELDELEKLLNDHVMTRETLSKKRSKRLVLLVDSLKKSLKKRNPVIIESRFQSVSREITNITKSIGRTDVWRLKLKLDFIQALSEIATENYSTAAEEGNEIINHLSELESKFPEVRKTVPVSLEEARKLVTLIKQKKYKKAELLTLKIIETIARKSDP